MAIILPSHTTRLKPARWNVQPYLTERPDLWRDLIAAWPIWPHPTSGAIGAPSNLLGSIGSSTSTTDVGGVTPYGPALFGSGTGYFNLDGTMDAAWTGTHRSVVAFVYTKYASSASEFYFGLQTQASASTSGGTVRFRQDAGKMRFEWQGGNIIGTKNLQYADSPYGVAYHVVGLTVPQGATAGSLYLNGQPETTSSEALVAKVQGPITHGNLLARGDDTQILWSAGDALLALYVWDRALTAEEHAIIGADPFVLIRPARHILQTTTAVTGTLAVTEAADSLAASGTVTAPTFTGTLAVTEQADSLAASGTFTPAPISGTLAVTETADSLAAAGTVTPPTVTGTLAVVEQADALAASGTITVPTVTGTLAVTEQPDALAAVGTFIAGPISGTLAVTEQADSLVASGTVRGTSFWQAGPVAFTSGAVGYDPVKASDPTPW